jgi:threonyl-tRNA synthetase
MEAAFYGPVGFMVKDALGDNGNGTLFKWIIQLPERFDLTYNLTTNYIDL